MNNTLILISIGPVQSFIASARKTEDLWAGSYLLSYLIEQSIEELHSLIDHYGGSLELIFPAEDQPVTLPQVAPYPNRILAKVEDVQEHIGEICQGLADFIYEKFEEICLFGLEDVFGEVQTNMKQMSVGQVRELLEIIWAVKPMASDYESARVGVESRLAAVKNNRFFGSGEQDGLVCTVCGEREALHETPFSETDRVGRMRHKLRATWEKRSFKYSAAEEKEETISGEEVFAGRIRDNEMLCGICLGKRTAREYFKSRTTKNIAPFPSVLTIAGDYRYYAIISMDGDDMGQWLSGLKGKFPIEPGTIEYNCLISSRLGAFAGQAVPEIITQAGGELVYAGGDDVLAFLPVDNVLRTINELRASFCHPDHGLHPEATASMGVAVVHKRHPLSSALEYARNGENRAKNYIHPITGRSKDAVCLTILTRGGEGRQFVVPWMTQGKFELTSNNNVVNLMEKVANHFGADFSSNFIQTFKASFQPILGSDQEEKVKLDILADQELNNHLLTSEMVRLLRRSLIQTQTFDKATLNELSSRLIEVNNVMGSGYEFIAWLESLQLFGSVLLHKEGEK